MVYCKIPLEILDTDMKKTGGMKISNLTEVLSGGFANHQGRKHLLLMLLLLWLLQYSSFIIFTAQNLLSFVHTILLWIKTFGFFSWEFSYDSADVRGKSPLQTVRIHLLQYHLRTQGGVYSSPGREPTRVTHSIISSVFKQLFFFVSKLNLYLQVRLQDVTQK